jgi:DNA-binding NarL/FixJ family response regulator
VTVDNAPTSSRVVLVEDDDDLRRLVRRVLSARPALEVVGEAHNGDSALAICAELEPDTVVLDLGLPDIAGRDVLTQLRGMLPAVRVVIFTGERTSRRAAAEWGADELVRKDEDIERLVRVLEDLAEAPVEATVSLDRSASSPGAARRFAHATVDQWGRHDLLDAALLVVSELVTNAVTHAGSECRVRLQLSSSVLRIEVADIGSGSPEPQPPTMTEEHGRGLLLVSAMSSAWGIDPLDDGKVVWAELR